MVQSILPEFPIGGNDLRLEPFGSGLINKTWRIRTGQKDYILQRINDDVFREPRLIAENVRRIADYLQKNHPGYLFIVPVRTTQNDDLVFRDGKGYFRLAPFVDGSHTQDMVTSPNEAFEAANQFGKFTALLSGFDATTLNITIPDFHNLTLRYEQFLESLSSGNTSRISNAAAEAAFITSHRHIVETYDEIISDPAFRIRVTHHDTKINNVLLDGQNKGLCVIDLDTVMPGFYISDLGDMMRTYLSPATEEETDLDKVSVREEIFRAIVEGYLKEMKVVLTLKEKQAFVYAGKFMIYMQAIRFLTDYFNNDRYYGEKYPGHNLNRAKNQIDLLQKLISVEERLSVILTQIINQ